jgi:hypothetical protein
VEGRAVADLMVVVLESGRRTVQQRCQPGLAVDQGQPGDVLAIDEGQIEKEKHERAPSCITGVLNEVEGRPAIRERSAKFAVQVGVLRRQPRDVLGDGGIFVGPNVAATGKNLHAAGVEPGVHAIPIELDLVQPIWPVWRGFDEGCKLGFDPGRRRSRINLSSGLTRRRGHRLLAHHEREGSRWSYRRPAAANAAKSATKSQKLRHWSTRATAPIASV